MVLAPETVVHTPPSDPLVGKLLDRYRVLAKIGEGGMGSVYRVEHVMLQKHMAMKLLRFELSQNQELVTRFQNEAIAAGRIGQENIVAVSDFGRTPDGLVYFVMEELIGDSLALAIYKEPGFPLDRTIAIAAQCCRALHAAHAVGIVHRDLKPENIVLTTREGFADFVKILDFGISKMTEVSPNPGGARLTRAGMIIGTPEYMSPEQAAGKVVDARSDIYSLGVVLFEMISGKLPFEADNPIQMLLRHQTGEVPTFSQSRPGLRVPGKLEKVVRKALSKRPEDRQQSMAELLTEVQVCAEGVEFTQPALRMPSRPGPPPPRTPRPGLSDTAVSLTPLETDMAASGLSRGRRGWLLGLVLLALLIGGVGGVLAMGRHEAQPPDPPVAPVEDAPAPVPTPLAPAPAFPPRAVAPVVVAPPVVIDPPVVVTPQPAAIAEELRPHGLRKSHPVAAHPAKGQPQQTHLKPSPVVTPAARSHEQDPYEKVDELKKPY